MQAKHLIPGYTWSYILSLSNRSASQPPQCMVKRGLRLEESVHGVKVPWTNNTHYQDKGMNMPGHMYMSPICLMNSHGGYLHFLGRGDMGSKWRQQWVAKLRPHAYWVLRIFSVPWIVSVSYVFYESRILSAQVFVYNSHNSLRWITSWSLCSVYSLLSSLL